MITTGSSFSLNLAHAPQAQTQPQTATPAKHPFSFGDFLDIINPLQHLPVVGTIYRAITGDKIDTPEKLVGDTIYGGPLGALSSLADIAFEKTTGHNFGDTILGFFSHHHGEAPKAVAQAEPAAATQPQTSVPAASQELALTDALQKSGTDPELARRALFAYRRTVSALAE
jgi:hypothetical protein